MDYSEIKWPNNTNFKGRNGITLCSGVAISEGLNCFHVTGSAHKKTVRITAINSKGEGMSCYIDIPYDKRLDVCLGLMPELRDIIKFIPDEAFPSLPSSLDTLVEQRIKGKREVYSCPKCGWESFCDDDYEQDCPQTGCDGKLTEIRTEEYEK